MQILEDPAEIIPCTGRAFVRSKIFENQHLVCHCENSRRGCSGRLKSTEHLCLCTCARAGFHYEGLAIGASYPSDIGQVAAMQTHPADWLGAKQSGSFFDLRVRRHGKARFNPGSVPVLNHDNMQLAEIAYWSRMATARVKPAEAPLIFTGKQETMKPVAGRLSRFESFSIWQ